MALVSYFRVDAPREQIAAVEPRGEENWDQDRHVQRGDADWNDPPQAADAAAADDAAVEATDEPAEVLLDADERLVAARCHDDPQLAIVGGPDQFVAEL